MTWACGSCPCPGPDFLEIVMLLPAGQYPGDQQSSNRRLGQAVGRRRGADRHAGSPLSPRPCSQVWSPQLANQGRSQNTASLISPRQELANERFPEQSKKEPGKTRPATSRSRISGLCSETSPKKSAPKRNPLPRQADPAYAQRFRDADFFGASSVASALDRCTGRDPIR